MAVCQGDTPQETVVAVLADGVDLDALESLVVEVEPEAEVASRGLLLAQRFTF